MTEITGHFMITDVYYSRWTHLLRNKQMSDSPLSVVLLLKELRQVTDWHMLGLYLEIPPHELKIIRQQFFSEGVERCKAELFDLWLRRNSNASWEKVVSALEQAEETVLANAVRKI